MKKPSKHAYINQFAIRCFRDTGDADYIAARMAYQGQLFSQFYWSATQAIEKYLKCILMLNRKKVKNFSHDIEKGFKLINEHMSFQITLTEIERDILDQISRQAADRYLILSYSVYDRELPKLDYLIWKLRQYCEPHDMTDIWGEPSEDTLVKNIEKVENRLSDQTEPAKNGYLKSGFLEKVLNDKEHPARQSLVWQNPKFTKSTHRKIKVRIGIHAVNAPFWLNPELLDEVLPYMYVPPRHAAEYREQAKQTAKERSKIS